MSFSLFFSFPPPPPTELYTLSLHDASSDLARRSLLETQHQHFSLPFQQLAQPVGGERPAFGVVRGDVTEDRKSTRLNSSHVSMSYAVFCLKKKKIKSTVLLLSEFLMQSDHP